MIRAMSIADILKLPSVDSEGSFPDGSDWSIKTALSYKSLNPSEHDSVMAEMEHDGYNRVPLHIDIGERMGPFYGVKIPLSMLSMLFMGNGHHRLLMMLELGFEYAWITDDPAESDDTGDDMYVNGYDGPDYAEDDDWM